MITSTGVGVGGVGGIGMLRARRRDVSVKPNRKLDRKSSRGMIYENEELRLRTIHINAEVEQGQNDIKKLRRENEQLRREIWCLREEYDKLEEILKSQQNRVDSDKNEGQSEDEVSTSEIEDDEDEEDGDSDDDKGAEEGPRKASIEEKEKRLRQDAKDEKNEDENNEKKKLFIPDDVIQDELLENAENQKLSSEKTNSLHRLHVEFDQLSVVDEEEVSTKKDKEYRDVNESRVLEIKRESESNKQEEGYLNQHAFNWIINSECPVTPVHSTTEHSHPYTSTLGIVATLNNESSPPLGIGWQREIFQGDTSHTTNTDGQTCAESIPSPLQALLPSRNTSTIHPDTHSFIDFMEVISNYNAPSSSSDNTTSTIVYKTSPDICVAGAISSQRTFTSSDQLSSHDTPETLNKSHSCQELDKSHTFISSINQTIAAKSLLDNKNTRAFKSQVRIQLNDSSNDNKISSEILPEFPPKMPPIDWLPGQPFYRSLEPIDRQEQRLLHQIQLNEYQATSFETPTPCNLSFPSTIPFQTYTQSPRSESKIGPACPNVPPTPRVDIQTQTRSRSSSQSRSLTRSQSRSSIDQDVFKIKPQSSKAKSKTKKNPTKTATTLVVSSNELKYEYDYNKPNRRSSSSAHEWQKKHVKNGGGGRSSLNLKRRSTRSRSVTQGPEIVDSTTISNRDRTTSASSPESDNYGKNSVSSEKVPWCACWGNGCL